jgi:peptide/nickel transport system substrate-binding protein
MLRDRVLHGRGFDVRSRAGNASVGRMIVQYLAKRGSLWWLICAGLLLFGGAALADTTPKRGGILEFAVDAEPPNYDCHGNFSFAFIHSVIPHYSTLLKFSTADYPKVEGDLAESWKVSPDRMTYTFRLRPDVRFHDGSKLTSADVAASFQRIIHPPPGVISARQAQYSAISAIDVPNPATVVFHLQWPEAIMEANFASPWNCIYSAEKLNADPLFPTTHILGSGPFVFVEHVKGDHWTGRRWDGYFKPGRPFLDGYRADYLTGQAAIQAMETGHVLAQFRSFTPAERDQLVESLGDQAVVRETPWNNVMPLVFNSTRPPFDDARVRLALSLAIDRWHAAAMLSGTTFLKYVGGLMRPGTAMGASEAELATLPGFSRDSAASRAEAKRLLAEAGQRNLHLTLTSRSDVPMPYDAAADLAVASWRDIGVTATVEKLPTKAWQAALDNGNFAAALGFGADTVDDPTEQLSHYISHDLSPLNHSGATDRFLDALFIGQAVTSDPRERLKIVREFERHVMSQADSVPLLWWNRIVVMSRRVKGWNITPSHFIGQDLTDVWLDP